MTYDPDRHTGRLRRLAPEAYRGEVWVHWIMTMEGRQTGWLTESMHRDVREALLHTVIRHRLICPAYCLMPDHAHFLWGGLERRSDQGRAGAFFRKEWNRRLRAAPGQSAFALQRQPFEHVLRREETGREAFQTISGYILENPVRQGLVTNFQAWPASGCVVAGYPDLDPRQDDPPFWEQYWKIDFRLRNEGWDG